MVDAIPGHVPPKQEDTPSVRLSYNMRYNIKLSMIPKGVHFTMSIILNLQKLAYTNHDILAYP